MAKAITYWVLTVLFCFAMGAGGVVDLIQIDAMKEGFAAMKMPLYVATILGVWKLAGVFALLIPKFPTLKEWAYAGFTFNLTGAAACHYFAQEETGKIIAPLVIWGLMMISRACRPASRGGFAAQVAAEPK